MAPNPYCRSLPLVQRSGLCSGSCSISLRCILLAVLVLSSTPSLVISELIPFRRIHRCTGRAARRSPSTSVTTKNSGKLFIYLADPTICHPASNDHSGPAAVNLSLSPKSKSPGLRDEQALIHLKKGPQTAIYNQKTSSVCR